MYLSFCFLTFSFLVGCRVVDSEQSLKLGFISCWQKYSPIHLTFTLPKLLNKAFCCKWDEKVLYQKMQHVSILEKACNVRCCLVYPHSGCRCPGSGLSRAPAWAGVRQQVMASVPAVCRSCGKLEFSSWFQYVPVCFKKTLRVSWWMEISFSAFKSN